MDLLRLTSSELDLTLFVGAVVEGGDVDLVHLRGAGVGGIIAFFEVSFSSSMDEQINS